MADRQVDEGWTRKTGSVSGAARETCLMITHGHVREADAADAPVLAGLRWASKHEDHEGDLSEPARPVSHAEDWIRERLASKRWLAWVSYSVELR